MSALAERSCAFEAMALNAPCALVSALSFMKLARFIQSNFAKQVEKNLTQPLPAKFTNFIQPKFIEKKLFQQLPAKLVESILIQLKPAKSAKSIQPKPVELESTKRPSLALALLLFLALLAAPLLAKPLRWSEKYPLVMEKNLTYIYTVAHDSGQSELQIKYTLYKNEGLVLVMRYDMFIYQTILYTDYQRDSFSIPLAFGSKSIARGAPYLSVYFKSYDMKNKRATLSLNVMGDATLAKVYFDANGNRRPPPDSN